MSSSTKTFGTKAASNAEISVYMTPPDANPYQHLLVDHLRPLGVRAELGGLGLKDLIARRVPCTADVLHLHWVAPLYSRPLWLRCWLRGQLVTRFLCHVRRRRQPLVWTLHNLWPHEMRHPAVDKQVRKALHCCSDAIICHSDEARQEYLKTFGKRDGVFVVPMGVYPVSRVPLPAREEARAFLGLPADQTVALMLGSARHYKGYDRVIRALPVLERTGVRVLLAGRGYGRSIAEGRGITCMNRFIPEYELPVLFAAADVLLLPYRTCTTSSLAIMGVGFGIPMVCSPVGPLCDICNRGLGVTCEPENPEDLRTGIESALSLDKERYAAARERFLDPLSWNRVAVQTLEVYRYVLRKE